MADIDVVGDLAAAMDSHSFPGAEPLPVTGALAEHWRGSGQALVTFIRAQSPEWVAELIGGEVDESLTWEGEAQIRVVGPWIEVTP